MCCDRADGTNCKSPALVCTTNAACAGQAPFTICAGASADGAQAASTNPTTYGGFGFGRCFPAAANIGVSRSFSAGTFAVNNGLLQWDTSALPDTAVVTRAAVTLAVSGRDDTDGRSFQGEWFNWGLACDTTDWTATAASTAFSVPTSSLAPNVDNTIALSGLAGTVNLTGRTLLRLHISGGQPTGLNRVIFAYFDHTTQPGPRLSVCYTLPTP